MILCALCSISLEDAQWAAALKPLRQSPILECTSYGYQFQQQPQDTYSDGPAKLECHESTSQGISNGVQVCQTAAAAKSPK